MCDDKMKSITIIVLLVALVSASVVSFQTEWSEYKVKYNKEYKNEEEDEFRKTVFEKSKTEVEKHNMKFEEGLVSFTIGINQFSDMTHEEYLQYYPSVEISNSWSSDVQRRQLDRLENITELPAEVDWRKKGAVSRVKDELQGCFSNWAFSITGAVEGQHFLKTRIMTELSEQNLIDCSNEGNDGCSGEFPYDAYNYIITNGGIDTETSYPYEAKNGKCRYNKDNSGATISSYLLVDAQNEDDLQKSVAAYGPVSVFIDARDKSFSQYNGGVYYKKNCSDWIMNRGALVVGYGTDAKKGDYWIVKNSWGKNWGLNGYILMARNRSNNCAIATMATFPVI